MQPYATGTLLLHFARSSAAKSGRLLATFSSAVHCSGVHPTRHPPCVPQASEGAEARAAACVAHASPPQRRAQLTSAIDVRGHAAKATGSSVVLQSHPPGWQPARATGRSRAPTASSHAIKGSRARVGARRAAADPPSAQRPQACTMLSQRKFLLGAHRPKASRRKPVVVLGGQHLLATWSRRRSWVGIRREPSRVRTVHWCLGSVPGAGGTSSGMQAA